jgi:antitoxin ParD1/3/4
MTSLNISLPEPLRDFVNAQVAKGNYGTASEYLRELIRDAQRREAERELEAKLLEGLRSEAREMTADDWAELRRRVHERHAARQASSRTEG